MNLILNVGGEHLSGELIDWDIVNKIFSSALREEFDIADFHQSNPKYRKQFAKLKREAEEAKKDLSYHEESFVFLENFIFTNDGDWVDFDYDISREELKEIMDPYIARSIDSCYEALAKASLDASDIKKIILVGGSTYSPVIRNILKKSSTLIWITVLALLPLFLVVPQYMRGIRLKIYNYFLKISF